ncbi:FecR family protein [Maribacter algicola]|uniref:FecR family protein n=1 Tax=Meishania litoralis TaxID=3434685 RepID=A0ACC7LKA3_9FLAO
MDDQIESLIIKFLTKEANIHELQQLELWIGNPENELLFHEYIKANTIMNMSVGKYDRKKAKTIVLRQIRKEKNFLGNRVMKFSFLKYAAAILIGALTFGYFYFTENEKISNPVVSSPVIDNETIKPGSDKATLTLEDGSIIDLDGGKTYQTKNISGNGRELIYADQESSKDIKYNYLTIPRGGEYFLKLADGTGVWLNSETQLKYPVSFVPDSPREVELVYGEAYFDVSPSTEHNGTKFIVTNRSQKIEVLGTEFNIKAYSDEKNIYSTLVEGSVAVINGPSRKELIPGQQSILDVEKNVVAVNTVDVASEVSWKDGVFIFREKPLKDIMKVISRWYDADVVFENKDLETLKFRGVIGKHQEVEHILSIMKSTTIKEYEIRDKTIVLR